MNIDIVCKGSYDVTCKTGLYKLSNVTSVNQFDRNKKVRKCSLRNYGYARWLQRC